MTRPEHLLHPRSAEIDVSVLESFLLGDPFRLVLVWEDGGGLGLAEDFQLAGGDLDRAGGEPGIGSPYPRANQPFDGDHVLAPQGSRLVDRGLVDVPEVEDDLGETVAVTQVDEDQPLALIAIGVDPTGQGDGLTDVVGPQLATHVGSFKHHRSCSG